LFVYFDREFFLKIKMCDEIKWKGSSIEQIFEGYNVYECTREAPDVQPSENHTVLFELPLREDVLPNPIFKSHENEDDFHQFVKLPCSKKSVYYELNDNEEPVQKYRWDLIRDSLTKEKIENSHDLADKIKSYNTKFADSWRFRALHRFFEDELLEEQQEQFFDEIMPKIIDLALQLPELIKCPLPFLRQQTNHSISMSKQQAACLLANAFLCTFPNRNVARKSTDYPEINFSRLFDSNGPHVVQKIKSIFNFFRRVLTVSMPTGVLTFERRYINEFPKWSESDLKISSIKWHTTSQGTIEDGHGMLQTDFANRYLGGGVLGFGCVQEEIRFVICPELIVGMLFCESMKPGETIHISGAEIWSRHSGYASKFKWEGNYIDETPLDKYRRKLSHIVAMDALSFHKPLMQFEEFLLSRESNKAYCAFFHNPNDEQKPIPVATGNW
jgi:poly(ADP-ribose) glycohydrolase